MRNKSTQKIPPALKHGAYTATSVLPGESQADFDKLHQGLIHEMNPCGALEDDIVKTIAHLVWRKQNLSTLRLAETANARYDTARRSCLDRRYQSDPLNFDLNSSFLTSEEKEEQQRQQAEEDKVILEDARRDLGLFYEFINIGDTTTFDGLTEELNIRSHLDAAITRCIKQLLMVRGIKSLSADVQSSSPKRISDPSKAA